MPDSKSKLIVSKKIFLQFDYEHDMVFLIETADALIRDAIDCLPGLATRSDAWFREIINRRCLALPV